MSLFDMGLNYLVHSFTEQLLGCSFKDYLETQMVVWLIVDEENLSDIVTGIL